MGNKQGEIIICEVLGGAYRGKGTALDVCLTHATRRVGEERESLCRIPVTSMLSGTTREIRESIPTCPTCRRRFLAVLTPEQKANRMAGAIARAEGWVSTEDLDFATAASPRAARFYALALAALDSIGVTL